MGKKHGRIAIRRDTDALTGTFTDVCEGRGFISLSYPSNGQVIESLKAEN